MARIRRGRGSILEIAWNFTADAVARHRNYVFTAWNAGEIISTEEESNAENRRWFMPGQVKGGGSPTSVWPLGWIFTSVDCSLKSAGLWRSLRRKTGFVI